MRHGSNITPAYAVLTGRYGMYVPQGVAVGGGALVVSGTCARSISVGVPEDVRSDDWGWWMTTALMPASLNPEPLLALVNNAVSSQETRRAYSSALRRFFLWYSATAPGQFSRPIVQAYRAHLEAIGCATSSINVALAALRKLAREAADSGYLSGEVAAGIADMAGIPQLGRRTGNWLTLKQAKGLLSMPAAHTLRGRRDKVVLGLLLGCGLRRHEAVRIDVHQLQERDKRPVLVDVIGKRRRTRTVPSPVWVAGDIRAWLKDAGIAEGPILRSFTRDGQVRGPMSASGIWWLVREYGATIGMPALAPHDLRRTFSQLSRRGGAELEQIQRALGHASVQTTEKYLGDGLDLSAAACDRLGVELK